MSSATSPVASRSSLLTALRVVAVLLTVMILLQAVLAGRILYEGTEETLHGILGNISFILVVAAVVLAAVLRAPKSIVAVAGALVLLMVVQIGLGYSTDEDTRSAGTWHIPLGVLIFGLAVYLQALIRRLAQSA